MMVTRNKKKKKGSKSQHELSGKADMTLLVKVGSVTQSQQGLSKLTPIEFESRHDFTFQRSI